jgi:hypothetical protein
MIVSRASFAEADPIVTIQPKKLLALAGFILITGGMVLVIGHFIWPEHFISVSNKFQAWGMKFKTHEVGFGVIAIGGLLLVVASLGKLPQPN